MQYRVVEKFVSYRTEWEDGPGSLQNVVTDHTSKRVLKEWTESESKPEAEVVKYAERFLPYAEDVEETCYHEHYFALERYGENTSQWLYVKTLKPKSYYEDWDE